MDMTAFWNHANYLIETSHDESDMGYYMGGMLDKYSWLEDSDSWTDALVEYWHSYWSGDQD